MVILVTVADDRFGRKSSNYTATQSKIKNIFTLNKNFGINDFFMWTWEDIQNSSFYAKNKKILDNPDPSINGRLYKPLVIYEALNNIKENDYLIYSDCSPEMWQLYDENHIIEENYNIDIIKKLCKLNNGILTAHVKWNDKIHVKKGEIGYHTHENFTTETCINKMGMQKYRHSLQHASGMIVLQKNKISIQFVEDWLYWNSIPECGGLAFDDGTYFWHQELIKFNKIGHRHDQSVSGLLVNKLNNKLIETLDYYERPNNSHPYNFLNFCIKDYKYNFFDSNQPPSKIIHKMIHISDSKLEVITEKRK